MILTLKNWDSTTGTRNPRGANTRRREMTVERMKGLGLQRIMPTVFEREEKRDHEEKG